MSVLPEIETIVQVIAVESDFAVLVATEKIFPVSLIATKICNRNTKSSIVTAYQVITALSFVNRILIIVS